jgi:N-acetylmuramoyl-L-alanine amidase
MQDPPQLLSRTTAALPAQRASKSLTRRWDSTLGRIVLDPDMADTISHHSRTGLHEKDLVLDIAKRLGGLLELRLGSEVLYTRPTTPLLPWRSAPSSPIKNAPICSSPFTQILSELPTSRTETFF